MKAPGLFAIAALFAAASVWAQEKTVDGLVINLGLMPAEKAVHALGHSEAHPATFPSGSQHVLISVADAKTHKPIGDATVVVNVRAPNGATVEKPLLRTQAAGMPDYSELFVFGSSGTYRLKVRVTPAHGPKSSETVFTVRHDLR
jgi:hypothetical protein